MRDHMIGLQKKKKKNYEFLPLGMPSPRVFWGANREKCEKPKKYLYKNTSEKLILPRI